VTAVPFALLDADANSILVQVLLTLFGMAIALCAVPTGIAAYKTVTAAQLPDATTQVNIVLRVGGATGGSAFTVVLASQLARGEAQAFQTTFWWLTATSLLALVGSLWLHRELRRADSAGEADLDGRPPCADRLPRVRPSGDRPRTGILTETQD
jgi:hypothetical protein